MASNLDRPAGQTASPHLVDELQGSFQDCMSILTSQEHFNVADTEEAKAGLEVSMQKFLDLARQTEAFFIHKRLILSKHRPEEEIKETTTELKAELERKDMLIKRHQERLQKWQTLLNSTTRGPGANIPAGNGHVNLTAPGGGQNVMTPTSIHHSQNIPSQSQITMSGQHNFPIGQQMGQPQVPQQMMAQRSGAGHQGMASHQPPPAYPQTPLAYLEQTMSNIGMPERR